MERAAANSNLPGSLAGRKGGPLVRLRSPHSGSVLRGLRHARKHRRSRRRGRLSRRSFVTSVPAFENAGGRKTSTVRQCDVGKKMRGRMSTLPASLCWTFATGLRITEAGYRKWLAGRAVKNDALSTSCVRNTGRLVLCTFVACRFCTLTVRPYALTEPFASRQASLI